MQRIEPWGRLPSLLGRVLGPRQRRKQPGKRCARPEIWRPPTAGSLSCPGPPREDDGRAVASGVGLAPSLPLDAPGKGAGGWAAPGRV